MTSSKKIFSLALIFLFLSVVAAHQASADTALRGGSGTANVLTADVLDPSNVSLGLFWETTKYTLAVDPKDTFFGLGVTAGLVSDLEIYGFIPLQIHEDDNTETGLGDSLIGLKYRFYDGGGIRPSGALFGAVALPTGNEDKGLGTGRTDVLLGLIGSKDVGLSTLSAQGAYRFVDSMDDVLQYGFGFILPNDKTLRFFLEYLGTIDPHGHGGDAGQFVGGLRYDIGQRWQVTAGGGFGVYGDGLEGPDWRVFAGFNYYTGGIPSRIPPAPEPPPEPAPPAPPAPPLEPPPPPAPPAPPPPPPEPPAPPPPPPEPPAPPPPPPEPPAPPPPPPAPPAPPPPPPPKMPPPQLENIYFEFDHFLMKPGDEIKLKEVAEYLKANPEARLVVEGHADSIGTATYNLGLGLRRAKTVVYYLIFDLGVPPSRVEFKSYGEMIPAEPNRTDEGRSRNRRGHLMVVE